MSAYLIYDFDVYFPDPYGEFMEQVKPLVEALGGKYLVRGGAHEVLEEIATELFDRTCRDC